MNIALEPEATSEDRKVPTDSLREYNKSHTAPDDHEPLNIFVRDDEIAYSRDDTGTRSL